MCGAIGCENRGKGCDEKSKDRCGDYENNKEYEKSVLESVVALAAPSLDPERFEALTDALTQLAKNRGIDYAA